MLAPSRKEENMSGEEATETFLKVLRQSPENTIRVLNKRLADLGETFDLTVKRVDIQQKYQAERNLIASRCSEEDRY